MKDLKKLSDSNPVISQGGRAEFYARKNGLKANHSKDIVGGADNGIDQFAILRKYSLKGFEYGNYVSNNDRYDHLIACQKALEHLAKIIGTNNLGINAEVGIAFGARGLGGRAAAHYEAALNMINLTKPSGAGCLAHEYGHALDYNLGSFVDQHKVYAALSGGWSTARTLTNNTGGQLRAMVNRIVDKVKQTPSYRELIAETDCDYWYRRTEVFARFFEQYICYKMRKIGTDKYLTHSWEFYIKSAYYLREAELMGIVEDADRLMKEIGRFLNGEGQLHATPYPALTTKAKATATTKPAKPAKKGTEKGTAKATDAEKVYRCAQLCGANKPCKYYNIGGPFMCGLKKKDIRDLTDCQKWHTKTTTAPKATKTATTPKVNAFAHYAKYTYTESDYKGRPYYKAYAKAVGDLQAKYEATKDREERKALRKQIKEANDKAIKRNIADLVDQTGLSKPLIEAMYRTTADDELRPVMYGIFFDPAGYVVTTDAHILCVVKVKVPAALSGKIITKYGTEIAGRYPNWEAVINRETPFLRTFTPDDNTAILKKINYSKAEIEAMQAAKPEEGANFEPTASHGAVCRLGKSWIKTHYVAKAVDILTLLGANTIQVFEKATERATVLQLPGKATVIIMPMLPCQLSPQALSKYIPLLK